VTFQRAAAGLCAVAGVALLAGLGWALLVAAGLLFLTPGGVRLHPIVARVKAWALAARSWVITAPRRAVAMAAMVVAIPVATAGVYVVAGWGQALITAGIALAGFSLAAGWNQAPPVTAGR
jgi:hypothetical protein